MVFQQSTFDKKTAISIYYKAELTNTKKKLTNRLRSASF